MDSSVILMETAITIWTMEIGPILWKIGTLDLPAFISPNKPFLALYPDLHMKLRPTITFKSRSQQLTKLIICMWAGAE